MAREPLPDPRWDESISVCLSCGYSLAGLAPPVPCPECGHLHTGRQFVVGGVPSARSVMSGGRIAAAAIITVAASFAPQLLMIVGMSVSWWFSLGALAVGVAVVVALVRSAPRRQGGKCLLVFANGSVTPMPLGGARPGDGGDSIGAVALAGDEELELRRISAVWCRLRLVRPGGEVSFDAGVRAPQESEAVLREAVAATVAQARPRLLAALMKEGAGGKAGGGPGGYTGSMNGPTTTSTSTEGG